MKMTREEITARIEELENQQKQYNMEIYSIEEKIADNRKELVELGLNLQRLKYDGMTLEEKIKSLEGKKVEIDGDVYEYIPRFRDSAYIRITKLLNDGIELTVTTSVMNSEKNYANDVVVRTAKNIKKYYHYEIPKKYQKYVDEILVKAVTLKI